jgi:hypothetical protein
LYGIPGSFVKINVTEDDTINFGPSSIIGESISGDTYPIKYNPIIRKWDGTKNPLQQVVSGDEGNYISLEDGIEIQFTEGTYRSGDYCSQLGKILVSYGKRRMVCPSLSLPKE